MSRLHDLLEPTPELPGLHVVLPDKNRAPKATYACRCGFVRTGTGVDEVAEIVTGHHQHKDNCSLNAAALAA